VSTAALAGSFEYYFRMVNVSKAKCILDGFPRAIEGFRHHRWIKLRFCHDTPLDIANYEDAPLRPHPFVLAARHSAVVLLNAGHDRSYKPNVLYDPVRISLPRLHAWLLWRTTLEPDDGLCAGPVRPSDISKMKF
jgi:hypothetical protein